MPLLYLLERVEHLRVQEVEVKSYIVIALLVLELKMAEELAPFHALVPEWLFGKFVRCRLFLSACQLSVKNGMMLAT
jgi:hypothetical protein